MSRPSFLVVEGVHSTHDRLVVGQLPYTYTNIDRRILLIGNQAELSKPEMVRINLIEGFRPRTSYSGPFLMDVTET